MTAADGPPVILTLGTERRRLGVYAAGSASVGEARPTSASSNDHGANVELPQTEARRLVDQLARVTGYYPTGIDAQRRRVGELADELRQLRNGDDTLAQLADLALTRHAGECVALAAELLYGCRELLTDRAVAEMVSELVLMADAMQLGTTLTNPEQRIAAHQVRINQLREQLPTSGEAADG